MTTDPSDIPAPAAKKTSKKTSTVSRDDTTKRITERDIKLLWGRSASRCAFPECQLELTMDSTAGDASTIGEMAHIVGEKEGAARGVSKMSLSQRNSYSNLILLCPTHHTIIDKKENIADYPIEILHEMKDAHETRVREVFAAKTSADPLDPSDILYADLVDRCTKSFMLDHWEWFADNAVQQILPQEIDEAQPRMAKLLLGTIWPGKHVALENAIKGSAAAFLEFAEHFHTKATIHGEFYKADRSYKKWPAQTGIPEEEVMTRWHQVSFLLLQRFVCHLNAFASEVRSALNPMYFLLRGEFLLQDALGVWHNMEDVIWKPELEMIDEALSKLGYTPAPPSDPN